MEPILRTACAGSASSGDVRITVAPADKTAITIVSPLLRRFGEAIRNTVEAVLAEQKVAAAVVTVEDFGALDWILRARLETAINRAKEGQ